MTRRGFIAAASVLSASGGAAGAAKPASLGGQPVRTAPFPSWPKFDAREEEALLKTLRSGNWFRGYGDNVSTFESAYAEATGAKHCIATANGTAALITSLSAAGVEPGDEVILPPYTFVACVNAILLLSAVPVFVDTDRDTFQIDARKLEALISDRTKALMPVHLGGNVADLDAILAIGRKHGIPVIEDACQAHFAEWRGRKVGTFGHSGCFSFQASKNLNSGEGGAILSSDDEMAGACFAFHNNGRGRSTGSYEFAYRTSGANLRMTEFQAALLLAQMTRLEEQMRSREQSAEYLTTLLDQIPGIEPAAMYEGCTRNAYHLYMFRYDQEAFDGLSRAKFIEALRAEGIPSSGGYSPLNKEPFIKAAVESPAYRALCSQAQVSGWEERTECPENDRLCEEAVWFTQRMMLAERSDMEQIAEAIEKLRRHAVELKRA